ncbi:gamma aminobutyric acid receptor subunit [Pycnococcus provasolii]
MSTTRIHVDESPSASGAVELSRGARPVVEVQVKVLNLRNIDARAGSFWADFWVMCRWTDENLVGMTRAGTMHKSEPAGNPGLQKCTKDAWDPSLYMANADDLTCIHSQLAVDMPNDKPDEPSKDGVVKFNLRFRGTLYQDFDLRQFPLDVHNLHIVVRTHKLANKVRLVQHTKRAKNELLDAARTQPDFIVEGVDSSTDETTTNFRGTYSEYHCLITVRRHVGYFVLKIFGPLCIIHATAFSTFALDATDIGGRMGIVLIIMLTTVAFLFLAEGNLPKLSYPTLADLYAFAVLFQEVALGAVVSASPHLSTSSSQLNNVDKTACVVLFVLWVLTNASAVFVGRSTSSGRVLLASKAIDKLT